MKRQLQGQHNFLFMNDLQYRLQFPLDNPFCQQLFYLITLEKPCESFLDLWPSDSIERP